MDYGNLLTATMISMIKLNKCTFSRQMQKENTISPSHDATIGAHFDYKNATNLCKILLYQAIFDL